MTAMLAGRVLYSDQLYFRHDGPRRYFWLLDEGVQLVYEPFGWRDEWYIDLVSIRRDESADPLCFHIEDRHVDIVVEGMGPTYRILDLDEAGTALSSGAQTPEGLRRTLTGAQRFLDRYLHRGAPFPPPQIRPLFSAEHHYPRWAAEPVRLKAVMPE
ncbi:hypothetical protein ACQPZP_41635 [Spirillospora sp. CA-142024]|uniref:hypothetical protein n=1 Tax=Spirillospora sp. CA-142024 TaxID=3240036 RepID=UPI003D8A4E01